MALHKLGFIVDFHHLEFSRALHKLGFIMAFHKLGFIMALYIRLYYGLRQRRFNYGRT
jgi:hypothetical protein